MADVSKRSQTGLWVGFFLALSIGVLAYLTQRDGEIASPSAVAGQTLPSFGLQDREGKRVESTAFKGRPAVIHFWATWCPPCLEELPQFLKTVEALKGERLSWVAVSLDKSWAEADRVLPLAKMPDGLTALLDAKQVVSDLFGSYQFPETYLVESSGKIRRKWIGPQDWSSQPIREALSDLARSP